MEDTLRVVLYMERLCSLLVLILVLMEDTLRELLLIVVTFLFQVLILVLMEDTLRAQAAPQTPF